MTYTNSHFPVYSFPFSTESSKGQSVIEYGSSPVGDIFVDRGDLKVLGRKNVASSRRPSYEIKSICMPLKDPNSYDNCNFPVFLSLDDVAFPALYDTHQGLGDVVVTNALPQFYRFVEDHPDIICESLSECCFENSQEFQMKMRQIHPQRITNTTNLPLRMQRKYFRSKILHTQKDQRCQNVLSKFFGKDEVSLLLDNITDIPKDLLIEYLSESLLDDYYTLQDDKHLGNCLGYVDNLLLFPRQAFDILTVQPLLEKCNPVGRKPLFEMDSSKLQKIALNGRVEEIECMKNPNGDSFVGVRSMHHCLFLNKTQLTSKENDQEYFKEVGHMETTARICSVAVNPYFIGEALITEENGTISHWIDGNTVEVLPKNGRNDSWIRCIFGSHPKKFLVVEEEEACSYDMRMPSLRKSFLIEVPTPQMNRLDKLGRAASLHPTNPHQFLLTSDQCLIVLDERHLQNPLLRINHHLQSTPKFMQIHKSQQEQEISVLTVLGNYKHRETRCIELSHKLATKAQFGVFRNCSWISSIPSPTVVSRRPWKLSYYDEWLKYIKDDYRTLSPAISSRIKEPLVGLSLVDCPNMKNNIAAIQLNKCGDLFYQLIQHVSDNKETLEHNKLMSGSFDAIEEYICKDWISKAYKDYVDNPQYNDCAKVRGFKVTTEKSVPGEIQQIQKKRYEKLNLLTNASDDAAVEYCSVCNFPKEEGKSSCTGCNLDFNVAGKMWLLKQKRGLLTRETIGLNHEVPSLDLATKVDVSKDPLSVVLLANWINDENYTPIDLSPKEANPLTEESNLKQTENLSKALDNVSHENSSDNINNRLECADKSSEVFETAVNDVVEGVKCSENPDIQAASDPNAAPEFDQGELRRYTDEEKIIENVNSEGKKGVPVVNVSAEGVEDVLVENASSLVRETPKIRDKRTKDNTLPSSVKEMNSPSRDSENDYSSAGGKRLKTEIDQRNEVCRKILTFSGCDKSQLSNSAEERWCETPTIVLRSRKLYNNTISSGTEPQIEHPYKGRTRRNRVVTSDMMSQDEDSFTHVSSRNSCPTVPSLTSSRIELPSQGRTLRNKQIASKRESLTERLRPLGDSTVSLTSELEGEHPQKCRTSLTESLTRTSDTESQIEHVDAVKAQRNAKDTTEKKPLDKFLQGNTSRQNQRETIERK